MHPNQTYTRLFVTMHACKHASKYEYTQGSTHLSKDHVFTIQMWRFVECDEKLRTIRVGPAGASVRESECVCEYMSLPDAYEFVSILICVCTHMFTRAHTLLSPRALRVRTPATASMHHRTGAYMPKPA
jgi:hypothetical protein